MKTLTINTPTDRIETLVTLEDTRGIEPAMDGVFVGCKGMLWYFDRVIEKPVVEVFSGEREKPTTLGQTQRHAIADAAIFARQVFGVAYIHAAKHNASWFVEVSIQPHDDEANRERIYHVYPHGDIVELWETESGDIKTKMFPKEWAHTDKLEARKFAAIHGVAAALGGRLYE